MIDIQLIRESLPLLLRGTKVTLEIAFLSSLIGIALGTVLGLVLARGPRFLKIITRLYVTVARGTPMLVQIFIVTYIFPELGISVSRFWAATLAIGFNSGAYVSQIVRAGINAVGRGQMEAARVLGFSSLQAMYYIILPQAMRIMLPALGNEFITLIKDSSLASVIGVTELTKEGSILRSTTLDAVTIFSAVACIYLVLTSLLSLIVHYLEQKMSSYAKY